MMRVFLGGATGAIGKLLVPRLVARGHEVHGMTRSEAKQAMLSKLGAVPVVADALDADQVAEAVGRTRPDVIVHELTAIGAADMRHFDRAFAMTNRLRARTVINWVGLAARVPGVSWRAVEVNGGPGALFLDAEERLIGVVALDIAGGQITSISSIVNPDKLTHLGPVADFRSLLRSAR